MGRFDSHLALHQTPCHDFPHPLWRAISVCENIQIRPLPSPSSLDPWLFTFSAADVFRHFFTPLLSIHAKSKAGVFLCLVKVDARLSNNKYHDPPSPYLYMRIKIKPHEWLVIMHGTLNLNPFVPFDLQMWNRGGKKKFQRFKVVAKV